MVKEDNMFILSLICIVIAVVSIISLIGIAIFAGCSAVHYEWMGVHDKLNRIIGEDKSSDDQ